MSEAKAKIRKGTLLNRRMLAEPIYQTRVEAVTEQALSFVAHHNVRCVHLFLPIIKNHEIDTWPLLRQLHDFGVRILISSTNFEAETMTHFVYSHDHTIEVGSFGIPSPSGGEEVSITEAELIFIPLLACDRKGNRIGYGKGFYDRLLVDTAPQSLKVGLSIAPPFDSFGFVEPHDFRLDYLITHKELIDCHD